DVSLGDAYERRKMPQDLQTRAEEYRVKLVEQVAEATEELMEKYREGEELTEDEIRAGVRELTITSQAYPVFCGSAFKNRGVQPMLDAVIDYLPSPMDVPAMLGHDPSDPEKEITRHAGEDDPFSALAFKIATHPFFGTLTFIRVYSGTAKPG